MLPATRSYCGVTFGTIASVDHEHSGGPGNGYEAFFGFHHAPFSLAADTRFRFQSASHTAALAHVTHALERREPVVVVTGEIGTGKTLLCRTVVERLERKTFLSIVTDPLLEHDDLLKQMLQDFGVISEDRSRLTPASRHDLVHALQEFLSSLVPLNAHAVVIIDEAQHLKPDMLESIRLVSNIQDERGTMPQIILVGQTDLDQLVSRPELRALKQRVSRSVRLDALTPAEVAQYIHHRLHVARERGTPSNIPGAQELQREIAEWERSPSEGTFTPDAVRAVAQLSRGIPRVVNLLCDRALEAAHVLELRTVDESVIGAAANALSLPPAPETGLSPLFESLRSPESPLSVPAAVPLPDEPPAPRATARTSRMRDRRRVARAHRRRGLVRGTCDASARPRQTRVTASSGDPAHPEPTDGAAGCSAAGDTGRSCHQRRPHHRHRPFLSRPTPQRHQRCRPRLSRLAPRRLLNQQERRSKSSSPRFARRRAQTMSPLVWRSSASRCGNASPEVGNRCSPARTDLPSRRAMRSSSSNAPVLPARKSRRSRASHAGALAHFSPLESETHGTNSNPNRRLEQPSGFSNNYCVI